MVRENVARNSHAPLEALMKLVTDMEWKVAKLVVRHPNMTEEALVRLSEGTKDTNERIRYQALVRLLAR